MNFDDYVEMFLYYLSKEGEKKSAKSLSLIRFSNDIISNYENIVAQRNKFDCWKHDIEIFYKMMSFVSGYEFINSITDIRSSGTFFRWYEKCWDYIQYFQNYPQNRFVNINLMMVL